MKLTTNDLIKILRNSVKVQYEESDILDPAYLSMSDDDILLYLKLGASRCCPNLISLEDLDENFYYPVIFLSKIELYTQLAVLKADKVDMGADNNNYIKQDQRFSHYMSLINQTQKQYENWLENEGKGEVNSFNVLLDKRYFTKRNMDIQTVPKVMLYLDNILDTSVSFHWTIKNFTRFFKYMVYLNKETPAFNPYLLGNNYKAKIDPNSILLLNTFDIRNNFFEVTGLIPNTMYFLCVISMEKNHLYGYSQLEFNTSSSENDEEVFHPDISK